jgi:hypothetical protein
MQEATEKMIDSRWNTGRRWEDSSVDDRVASFLDRKTSVVMLEAEGEEGGRISSNGGVCVIVNPETALVDVQLHPTVNCWIN